MIKIELTEEESQIVVKDLEATYPNTSKHKELNEKIRAQIKSQLTPSDKELRATCLRGEYKPRWNEDILYIPLFWMNPVWMNPEIRSNKASGFAENVKKFIAKNEYVFFPASRRDLAEEYLRMLKGEAMPKKGDRVWVLHRRNLSFDTLAQGAIMEFDATEKVWIYFYSEKAMLRFIEEHKPKEKEPEDKREFNYWDGKLCFDDVKTSGDFSSAAVAELNSMLSRITALEQAADLKAKLS